MISQQQQARPDESIPLPYLDVRLHVLPDFTGRVVLHVENGKVICHRRLLEDEHICALDTFIEMAREAGLRIREVTSVTDSDPRT